METHCGETRSRDSVSAFSCTSSRACLVGMKPMSLKRWLDPAPRLSRAELAEGRGVTAAPPPQSWQEGFSQACSPLLKNSAQWLGLFMKKIHLKSSSEGLQPLLLRANLSQGPR